MAIVYKCKSCGAQLNVTDLDAKWVECEYCETKQTLPVFSTDKKINLFTRADRFWRAGEYDKAQGIFEGMLEEDSTDPEIYWRNLLCKFGVTYVDDPKTGEKKPTVNRMQNTMILAEDDYKKAIELASAEQKSIYQEEAKEIARIQKKFLEISSKEEPFDVFISYKETDANGRRTRDSVVAQDLYENLIKSGLKVFFSRKTLEEKLGVEYEPYIFSALTSAKVMVLVCTDINYITATWVKNEWTRYLALMHNDGEKALITAYRGIDVYDLPEELAGFQAQDMEKLGFMQDLTSGIKKLVGKKGYDSSSSSKGGNASTSKMKETCWRRLAEGKFSTVIESANKMLDIDPTDAETACLLVLAKERIHTIDELMCCDDTTLLERIFVGDSQHEMCREFIGDEKISILQKALAQYKKNRDSIGRIRSKSREIKLKVETAIEEGIPVVDGRVEVVNKFDNVLKNLAENKNRDLDKEKRISSERTSVAVIKRDKNIEQIETDRKNFYADIEKGNSLTVEWKKFGKNGILFLSIIILLSLMTIIGVICMPVFIVESGYYWDLAWDYWDMIDRDDPNYQDSEAYRFYDYYYDLQDYYHPKLSLGIGIPFIVLGVAVSGFLLVASKVNGYCIKATGLASYVGKYSNEKKKLKHDGGDIYCSNVIMIICVSVTGGLVPLILSCIKIAQICKRLELIKTCLRNCEIRSYEFDKNRPNLINEQKQQCEGQKEKISAEYDEKVAVINDTYASEIEKAKSQFIAGMMTAIERYDADFARLDEKKLNKVKTTLSVAKVDYESLVKDTESSFAELYTLVSGLGEYVRDKNLYSKYVTGKKEEGEKVRQELIDCVEKLESRVNAMGKYEAQHIDEEELSKKADSMISKSYISYKEDRNLVQSDSSQLMNIKKQ